jgi:uncharacterized protein YcbK (DUF882 family)
MIARRVAALVLVLVATTAHATPPDGGAPPDLPATRPPSPAKKDLARAAKSTHHPAPLAAGTRPAPLINLYNEHTHEWLAIDPSEPPTQVELDDFLRDHYTNKTTHMDPKLAAFVLGAAASFHREVVDIVSGFRHPKYNLILRKKGHQVARDSQHTHGNAIDFFLPDVTTEQLHAWAKAQHAGGVGLYLASGFVHMDTGPIRFWSGD